MFGAPETGVTVFVADVVAAAFVWPSVPARLALPTVPVVRPVPEIGRAPLQSASEGRTHPGKLEAKRTEPPPVTLPDEPLVPAVTVALAPADPPLGVGETVTEALGVAVVESPVAGVAVAALSVGVGCSRDGSRHCG